MANNITLDVSVDDADRKYRAPALEKGLDILELLARHGAPMTTSQMAVTLGRSVSELFRMVLALEFRGYIESSSDGREGYKLTNKLFTLGIAQGSTRSLLEIALPVMKDLAYELGQSCHLVVPSGDQIVVVGRIESPMDLGFSVRVGYRRRLVETNSGKLLFGLAPVETRSSWLSHLRATADEETIERFLKSAKVAADMGYVQSTSDFVEGVVDISVPILGMSGAAAVLNVPFISIKSQEVTYDQVIDRLKYSTRKIAEALSNEGR